MKAEFREITFTCFLMQLSMNMNKNYNYLHEIHTEYWLVEQNFPLISTRFMSLITEN